MPQVYNQIQFNFHQILLRTLIIYVDKQMCLKSKLKIPKFFSFLLKIPDTMSVCARSKGNESLTQFLIF